MANIYIGELSMGAVVEEHRLTTGSARIICVPVMNGFGGGISKMSYNIDSSFFNVLGEVPFIRGECGFSFPSRYKDLISKAVSRFGNKEPMFVLFGNGDVPQNNFSLQLEYLSPDKIYTTRISNSDILEKLDRFARRF